jgi:hypothetical protein
MKAVTLFWCGGFFGHKRGTLPENSLGWLFINGLLLYLFGGDTQ